MFGKCRLYKDGERMEEHSYQKSFFSHLSLHIFTEEFFIFRGEITFRRLLVVHRDGNFSALVFTLAIV